MFAPLHHQAMKYVMSVRQKIAEKTLFNLLGPHTNPCGAKKQVLGVYDEKLVSSFSNVAQNLGMEHVLVVHGDDGLDEISICAETKIAELKDNNINEYKISPKSFGLKFSSFDEITANSSEESSILINKAFAGENTSGLALAVSLARSPFLIVTINLLSLSTATFSSSSACL